MNQDNLLSRVNRVRTEKKTSKGGAQYNTLTLDFTMPNGEVYACRVLITEEQATLISLSVANTADSHFSEQQ